MARCGTPITNRYGRRSTRSGLFKCLTLLVVSLQSIAACGGSDDPGASDGQMAGGSGADSSANAGAAGHDAGAAGHDASAAGHDAGPPSDEAGTTGEGGGTGGASFEGGASGTGDGFVPAPHPPFPLVTAHGGPIIQNIQLVPVYFGADPLLEGLEKFNTWLVGSSYWKTVGADYGVGAGQKLPAVQYGSAPASPTSTLQIRSWLDQQIAGGSLPKPNAQTVFVLYYPAETTITIDGFASCSVFAGLHDEAVIANDVFTGKIPFVVIPRCSFEAGDELMIATNVASHEIIEAATDPLGRSDPAWKMDNISGPLEAWEMLTGPEVADLCFNQSYDEIEGHTVQDIWSNSAAQAGNNPCQPSDPKHPFFTVSAETTIYHAQPGTTLSINAGAWSNLPTDDWELGVNWGYVPYSDFDGHAELSKTIVNNGDQVTATVTIPANLPTGNGRAVYRFTIDSIDPINPNFSHPWPFLIVVP